MLTVAEVKKAKELGMKVIPWTVNEPDDMRKMLRLGVDGLITDYPNRFNKLVKKD
jgi:glycerophosphoryl diester phosphodiesterase